jgi:carbonic anhydrase
MSKINNENKEIIKKLNEGNQKYVSKNQDKIVRFSEKQNPKIALLTCSDSRVIPEYIFSKSIGDVFVVRVAGNITIDPSVISSFEYAVEYLNINLIIIMGHTKCGAISLAEKCTNNDCGPLLNEIKKSFNLQYDHVKNNTINQLKLLPKRSNIIKKALNENKIEIVGAIYNTQDGSVEFL